VLLPEKEGGIFCNAIENLSENICAMPSLFVTEKKVTTIGLGDSFVGGFIPFLTSLVRKDSV
jgi:sugar/nucleoside kinase (ribokinase family)